MAFSRAKVKRFNEVTTCAPPPGHYDPKLLDKVQGPSLNTKDERFKDIKDETPGPNLGLSILDRPDRIRSSSVSSSHSGRLGKSPSKPGVSTAPSVESLASMQSEPAPRKSGIPKIMPPADFARVKDWEKKYKLLVEERNYLHQSLQMKSEELLKLQKRFDMCMKDKAELESSTMDKNKMSCTSSTGKSKIPKLGNKTVLTNRGSGCGDGDSRKSEGGDLIDHLNRAGEDEVFNGANTMPNNEIVNNDNIKDDDVDDGEDDNQNNDNTLYDNDGDADVENEIVKGEYEAKLKENGAERTDLLGQIYIAQNHFNSDCQKCLELSSTINKLRAEFSVFESSNKDKDEKLSSLESEISNLTKECENYKISISDSSEKCNSLNAENTDLKNLVEQLEVIKKVNSNLIQKLETDLKESNSKYNLFVESTQNEKDELNKIILELQEKPSELNKEIEILRTDLEASNSKLEAKTVEMIKIEKNLNKTNNIILCLKETIGTLQRESEALKSENENISEEFVHIKNAKINFQTLLNQKLIELQDSKEKINEINNLLHAKITNIDDLNVQINSQESQITKMEQDFKDLSSKILSLETEKIHLLDELKTLDDVKKTLEVEARELKSSNIKHEDEIKKVTENRDYEILKLNSEIEILNMKYTEKLSQMEQAESKITSLNSEILKMECDLSEMKDNAETEKSNYETKVKNFEVLCEKLTTENSVLLKELDAVWSKKETVIKEITSEFNSKINDLVKEMNDKKIDFEATLASETMSWSVQLSEIEKKLNVTENLLLESEEKLKSSTQEFNDQIQNLKLDLEASEILKTNLETEIKSKDSEVSNLSNEKMKLDSELSFRVVELELARSERDRLDGLCCANKILINNLNDVVSRLKLSESDLKKSNSDLVTQVNDLRESFDIKMVDMQKTIDSLNIAVDSKDKKINELKVDLDSKSQKIIDSELEHVKTKKELVDIESKLWENEKVINQLKEINRTTERTIQDFEAAIVEKDEKIESMENQIKSHSEMIMKLEDLCSTKDNELMKIENALHEKDLKLKEIEREHQSKLADLKYVELDSNELKVKVSRIENLLKTKNEQNERLKAELLQMEAKLKSVEDACSKVKLTLENECSDLLKQLDRKELELSDVSTDLRIKDSALQRLLLGVQSRENELEREINNLTMENKKLLKEKIWLQLKVDEISTELSNQQLSLKKEIERSLADEKAKTSEKIREYDLLVEKMTTLQQQCDRWKFMYEDLAAKVEPFKDQLEQFELEKQALLSRHKNAQNEVDKLSKEYAKVLGHQNHKQKIHHMVKLKDENLSLKNEVENLRTKDTMNRRRIEKLTEKLDALEGKKKYDPSLAFKNCWENPRETQNFNHSTLENPRESQSVNRTTSSLAASDNQGPYMEVVSENRGRILRGSSSNRPDTTSSRDDYEDGGDFGGNSNRDGRGFGGNTNKDGRGFGGNNNNKDNRGFGGNNNKDNRGFGGNRIKDSRCFGGNSSKDGSNFGVTSNKDGRDASGFSSFSSFAKENDNRKFSLAPQSDVTADTSRKYSMSSPSSSSSSKSHLREGNR